MKEITLIQPVSGAYYLGVEFPNSSAIDAVVYGTNSRRLAVQFTGGRRYIYLNVDPGAFMWLLLAPSAGAFVNQHIKGLYDVIKVDEETTPLAGLIDALKDNV